MKKYDTVVLIGRFQPVHRAHVEILRRAHELGDQVKVIIGSSFLPRTYKNPFTFQERVNMITESLYEAGLPAQSAFSFSGSPDFYDDQKWAQNIQQLVGSESGKTLLIGHNKDESTYYLEMFPQWEFLDVEAIEPLNATDIRSLYFRKDFNLSYLKSVLPESVQKWLLDFAETEDFQQVIRERIHIETYRKQYEHLPFAPVFVTVDNVIFQSGHVLMVKRRSEPGKGLWALPGGFLNASTDRSLEDAALRELKEETNIKVPIPVLRGSIKGSHVFDALHRSARGRTITHAFHYVLNGPDLPKVRGADDAEKAMWIPIAHVHREMCFEDHYLILHHFLGD